MQIEYIKCDSYDATTNIMVISGFSSKILEQNVKTGLFSKPIDIPRVGEYVMVYPKEYIVCKVVHFLQNKEFDKYNGKTIYVIEK